MKLACLLLLVVATTANAAPDADLDPKAVAARIAKCPRPDPQDVPDAPEKPIGVIQRVEPIPGRSPTEAVHVIGASARAYVFFEHDGCAIVPVVGRAAAVVKGNFGGGATVAYIVRHPACSKWFCPSAVSLKSADDKLVGAIHIADCINRAELAKVKLAADRDSLRLACWKGVVDLDRMDALLDFDGVLASLIESDGGTAWVQTTTPKECVARPPGGIAIVKTGDRPEIDVSQPATAEQADAAKLPLKRGCDATISTVRHVLDPAKRRFVPAGRAKVANVHGLCPCK